ncbi:MAG: hypothetical protein OEL53_02315 [Rhodospirillales bacterium]|nr:hypothetical protein [Rhodospirillales bacterium]
MTNASDSIPASNSDPSVEPERHGSHHHHHYYYPASPQGAPLPSAPFAQAWGDAAAVGPGGLDPLSPPGSPAFAQSHQHRGDAFVKGLLIGAGVTVLLTNEPLQKNLMKSAVRLWSMMQGGVEEMKERFRDAEAEIKVASDETP